MIKKATWNVFQGFYYNYYKKIVEADTLYNGLEKLVSDGTVEYPDVITPIQRFNLLPEVRFFLLYHMVGISILGYFPEDS